MRKLFRQNGLSILTSNTMMLDWDTPHDSHKFQAAITIQNSMEPVLILQDLCKQSDSWLWTLYRTPGGMRAFCLSHYWDITNSCQWAVAKALMTNLKCDPCYIYFTEVTKMYNARVSPKPNRSNDFVARHILTIGQGKPLPYNTCSVTIHDLMINRHLNVSPTESLIKI